MMKYFLFAFCFSGLALFLDSCTNNEKTMSSQIGKDRFSQYPALMISNDEVKMKVYLPDTEKGLYRGTRFDWSGVIGSVQYKGHEYFGYWKKTHDPFFHEDLSGPVEGYIEPGLGYEEATSGGKFIRIGVGILEKPEEVAYQMVKTYNILDHGKWIINHGPDWIEFTHEIASDFGYSYIYTKKISLTMDKPGFKLEHNLKNTGTKLIETDQFNHNFFMIDGERSGTAFQLSFPFAVSTEDDLKGYMKIEDRDLFFINDIKKDDPIFLNLKGYGEKAADHKVTVKNKKSGAGVTFTVDKPLHRIAFWACETTLSPENFIFISVPPGEEENWVSEYGLFVEE
ncbi:MAG: hypothetical protein GY705_13545 [Bacteroidetes bacterium]|nr:hypothetical protein [Bacteroidota bacterium]